MVSTNFPHQFLCDFFQPPFKPHPIHPNTIYRLWSPVSKKNDGVMMRNPSTDIVNCDGTFISGDDSTYIILLI